MAVDKLVDSTQLDADLTSVANAIRTKGGTSAQLAFPAEFVSAINAIPSGGGSNWKKLASQEFTVNTTSTSNTSVGNIQITLSDYNDKNIVVWVHVRDKAGKRNGYHYGTDAIFFPYQLANGSTSSLSTRPVILFTVNSSGSYSGTASAYGVYGYRVYYTSSNHYAQIYSRYNSNYGTINGTFVCDVYALTMPTGLTLFA